MIVLEEGWMKETNSNSSLDACKCWIHVLLAGLSARAFRTAMENEPYRDRRKGDKRKKFLE